MYNAVSNYQVCPFDANHRLPQGIHFIPFFFAFVNSVSVLCMLYWRSILSTVVCVYINTMKTTFLLRFDF